MYWWQAKKLKERFTKGLIHAEGEDGGGGGGSDTGVPEWAKGIPESVQGWDEVKNSDTAEKFWDQMSNQRSRMGRSITIPGEDAGTDDIAAFHAKLQSKVPGLVAKPDLENDDAMALHYGSLGRPEKAEDYEVKKVEGVDMSQAEEFRGIAHKYGLNKKQFGGIVAEITAANQVKSDAIMEIHKKGHADLVAEWGADHGRRMSVATTIAQLTDAPEAIVTALKAGQGSPSDYKWLYGLALKFKGEGKNLMQDINDGDTKITPGEAKQQINEIRGNKQHAYWNKSDPGHKAAMKLMNELYAAKQVKKAG